MNEQKKSPELLAQERGEIELAETQDKDKNNPVNSQIAPAKFSYFTGGITSTKPRDNTMTIPRLARGIREHFQDETNKIRQYLAMGDTDKADEIKRGLPYATPAGTFAKRNNSELLTYSSLMVLDIDDLDDVNDAKQKVLSQKDVDIILLFVSPSGHGVKVFVPSTTAGEHLQVFRMYQRYFAEVLGLQIDESGKDVARACFVCHDPDVYVSEKYQFRKLDRYWTEPQQRPVDDLQRAGGAGAPSDADNVAKVYQIVAEIKSRGVDIAPEYNDYLKLGFALATLGETARAAYHAVCAQSPKYNQKDADAKFSECLKSSRGDVSLATFFDLAKRAGVNIKNTERKRTRTQKDDTLNAEIVDDEDFNWYYFKDGDEVNGEVISNPARIAKFIERENFKRISEPGDDRVVIIRSEVKTLKPFNHEVDTVSYLKNHIKHPAREMDIANWLAKNMKNPNTVWKLLDGTPYNLQKDTRDAVFLYFKNGVAKVTQDGVKMIDYADPSIGFYPEVVSMGHVFNNTLPDLQSISKRKAGKFERFLIYAVAGSDKNIPKDKYDNVKAFYSMIGYLVSNYKDSANTKAIILSDENADGESRRGGRGKTLITEAIQQVRSSLKRGGNEFDKGYRHVFSDLERWHDLYVIDDIGYDFDFNSLYTNISGSILAERKGSKPVTIPFADTPKFTITTNWLVRFDKDAVSTNRRFLEYKLSEFWGEENKPFIYFGENFFQGWDETEWQSFFEFVCACIVMYLKNGLLSIEYPKTEDNYLVYFHSDVEEQLFEGVFESFINKAWFTTTDFHNKYNEIGGWNGGRWKKNSHMRVPIEVYIEKHKLPWRYDKKDTRKFVKVDVPDSDNTGDDGKNITDDLPF